MAMNHKHSSRIGMVIDSWVISKQAILILFLLCYFVPACLNFARQAEKPNEQL